MIPSQRTVAALLIATVAALLPAAAVYAAAPASPGKRAPSTTWIHPVIKDYGGVHPRPELPLQPDPAADYKVIVDVVHGSKDPSKVMGSLQRLARLRNLMGYAHVPADHVHIVAVLDERSAYAALTDAAYRKHFKVGNPNLKLLHELKASGVQLLICSQALAGMGWPDTSISPDVTITLSALSDFAIYGQRGYAYMQL